jgi:hypothetical protein
MAQRRDRREKQRRQRQQPRARRGGLTNQLIVAGVIVGLVILLFAGLRAAGVFDPPPSQADFNDPQFDPSGQTIGELMPDQGTQHIQAGQPGHYNSEPPTSGEHWSSLSPAAPAPWGIKDSMLPREVTTHNLEHGGIVIAYNNLSSAEVDQLKSLVRGLSNGAYRKIILEPYPPLGDAKVAVTAWRWLLKLPSVDQTQIVKFVRAHYSDQKYAPEWNLT